MNTKAKQSADCWHRIHLCSPARVPFDPLHNVPISAVFFTGNQPWHAISHLQGMLSFCVFFLLLLRSWFSLFTISFALQLHCIKHNRCSSTVCPFEPGTLKLSQWQLWAFPANFCTVTFRAIESFNGYNQPSRGNTQIHSSLRFYANKCFLKWAWKTLTLLLPSSLWGGQVLTSSSFCSDSGITSLLSSWNAFPYCHCLFFCVFLHNSSSKFCTTKHYPLNIWSLTEIAWKQSNEITLAEFPVSVMHFLVRKAHFVICQEAYRQINLLRAIGLSFPFFLVLISLFFSSGPLIWSLFSPSPPLLPYTPPHHHA